jgi:AcrR family transcriptional regulator
MAGEHRVTTKDRIIETAIRLFNTCGTSRVTTNHIAEEMGISPGNLYYHYRNKEEIIRCIWEKMTSEIHVPFEYKDLAPDERGLADFLFQFFRVKYDYRFFWLEMAVLIEKDPVLKERYLARSRMLLDVYKTAVDNWAEKGCLRHSMSDEERNALVENTWFISQFWAMNCLIHDGYVTPENMKKGAQRILSLLNSALEK